MLICHSSYRGVIELFRALFDLPISIGTIHNRLEAAAATAAEINQSQDLSGIEVGLHDVMQAVEKALKETPRASSMVENLNSRLRNYFFLRRSLGDDYLSLLRFFLNHRQFMRSRIPERVGKSPRELLTDESPPHWLALLGFERFQRA